MVLTKINLIHFLKLYKFKKLLQVSFLNPKEFFFHFYCELFLGIIVHQLNQEKSMEHLKNLRSLVSDFFQNLGSLDVFLPKIHKLGCLCAYIYYCMSKDNFCLKILLRGTPWTLELCLMYEQLVLFLDLIFLLHFY